MYGRHSTGRERLRTASLSVSRHANDSLPERRRSGAASFRVLSLRLRMTAVAAVLHPWTNPIFPYLVARYEVAKVQTDEAAAA